MTKFGYLRPWWLWLGALAAVVSVLAFLTRGVGVPWYGAAAVGATVLVGGVLMRLRNTIFPSPHPTNVDLGDRSLYVGIAVWIAGLTIGLTVSENWIERGDYAFVVGIAAAWVPVTVVVMRRFPSQHHLGRTFGMLGAWLAPIIPLSRALPETWSTAGRSAVVGLAAAGLGAVFQIAVGPGSKHPATDGSSLDAR